MACDVLQWAYAYENDYWGDDEEDESVTVGCDLDESSLLNHGDKGVANVGYIDPDDFVHAPIVALRNIEAGEELLEDYDVFDEELEWFDKLVDAKWSQILW